METTATYSNLSIGAEARVGVAVVAISGTKAPAREPVVLNLESDPISDSTNNTDFSISKMASSGDVKSGTRVMSEFLAYLDGLCDPRGKEEEEKKDGEGDGVRVCGTGGAGLSDEMGTVPGGEVGHGAAAVAESIDAETKEGRPLEYYYRLRFMDRLNDEQVGGWSQLVADIEALNITICAEAKTSPLFFVQNPGYLIKLIKLFNEITTFDNEGEKVSLVTTDAELESDNGYKTPQDDTTEPFPLYSEGKARNLSENPPTPYGIPIRANTPPNPSPPTPTKSIALGNETYIGLTRHNVEVPGVHVNIADIQLNGSNTIKWNDMLWYKLRTVRMLSKTPDVARPSSLPPPILPSPMFSSPTSSTPMFPSPMFPSPMASMFSRRMGPFVSHGPDAIPPLVSPSLGFHVQGVGLGLGGSVHCPGSSGVEDHVHGEPAPELIMGEFYTMIRSGYMQGSYVSHKESFTLAGMDWVRELLIVPAADVE